MSDIIAALEMLQDELSMMDNDEFEDNQFCVCNQLQGIIEALQVIMEEGDKNG